MRKIFMTVILSGLIAACGGSSKKPAAGSADKAVKEAPEPPPATDGMETGEEEGGEHHAEGAGGGSGEGEHDWGVPEMKTFHDVLHPVWHDLVPKKDWKGVCGAAPKLAETAGALKVASAPRDKRKAFTDQAMKVADAAEDLAASCNPAKGDEVEANLTKVHHAFHDLSAIFGHNK